MPRNVTNNTGKRISAEEVVKGVIGRDLLNQSVAHSSIHPLNINNPLQPAAIGIADLFPDNY